MDLNLFPEGYTDETTNVDTAAFINSVDEETKEQEEQIELAAQASQPSQSQDSDRVAGSGAERNPIDAIAAFGADIVDNVFGGDKKTYEEIRDKITQVSAYELPGMISNSYRMPTAPPLTEAEKNDPDLEMDKVKAKLQKKLEQ